MLKKLVTVSLIILVSIAGYAQGPTNGYPPKVNSYGMQLNRVRPDSAGHMPHKYLLTLNTTDTTPQIFAYSTPSGDSLVYFVNGRYHIVGITGGGGTTYSADETTLHLTGTTFSIKSTYPGQSSIATVGTITSGIWQSTAIADLYISSSATWNAKQTSVLNSANIWVGNGSNIAAPRVPSGAVTMDNTGAFSLSPVITGGSCTNCNLTYNGAGQLTVASNGSGGGGGNPFADNTSLVKNNADNTRQVIISAGSVATGTTRTLTAPNADGTIVLNDNTVTISGKTISAGSNTITNIANGNLSGSAGITNANLAPMAGHTYKGVNGGSSATPSDVTNTQLTADLNPFTTSLQGLVPSPGGTSSGRVLQDDGSWHAPAAGFANPMTTAGDIIIGGSAGSPLRLAAGGTHTVLHGGGTYSAVDLNSADVTNALQDVNISSATTWNAKQAALSSGNGTTLNSNKIDLGGTKTATSILVGNALMRTQHIENFQVGDTAAILGQTFQDNFARGSLGSNWSASAGDQVITWTGTAMRVGSTLNGFGDYIKTTAISGVNSDTIQLDFVVDTIGATTYGPGIGFIDAAGFPTGYICQYGTATGGLMKIFLRYYDGSTVLATSTNAVTMSVGDTMRAQLIRQDDAFKTYYYNRTVGGTDSCSKAYTFTRLASDPTTPGTGFRAIYFLGGRQDITGYRVASPEPKYTTAVTSHSIGCGGYNATVMTNSWPYLVFPSRGLFAKVGGSGDRTSDAVADTAILRQLGVKYAILDCTINDVTSSVPASTTSTNVQAWANYCIAAGIVPVLIECTPGRVATPSKVYSDTLRAIAARITGTVMINGIYDALRTGVSWNTTYSADSVHPNDAGHAIMAGIIKAGLPAGALQTYNLIARNLPAAVVTAKLATIDSAGNFGVGPNLSTIQIIGNTVRVGPQLILPNSTTPGLSISSHNGATGVMVIQNLDVNGWDAEMTYNNLGQLVELHGHANSGTTSGNGSIPDSTYINKTYNGVTRGYEFYGGDNNATSAYSDLSIRRGAVMLGNHTSSGRALNPKQGMIYWDSDSLGYVTYTTATGWVLWWRLIPNAGAYVPTLANITNVSTTTSDSAFWTRDKNIVTVYGSFSVTPSASGNTSFSISLPFASNIQNHSLWGMANTLAPITGGAIINPNTGGLASFVYTAITTSSTTFNYSFRYIIQ